MAYSKSPRPHRRYSVFMKSGSVYYMRAHDLPHAIKLAVARGLRENPPSTKILGVFEGTVKRATS